MTTTVTLLSPGAGSYHLPSTKRTWDGVSLLTMCGMPTDPMRKIEGTPDYACRRCQQAAAR